MAMFRLHFASEKTDALPANARALLLARCGFRGSVRADTCFSDSTLLPTDAGGALRSVHLDSGLLFTVGERQQSAVGRSVDELGPVETVGVGPDKGSLINK
jgi:hypothetical protein